MIYVNEKDLVVPGEVLAEDDYYSGRGTFEENGKICSKLLGLVSLRNKKVSVVPLKSKYLPKKGDVVIGKISDVRFSMWEVDLNSPYSGILPASEVFGRDKKELSRVFDVGDVLFLRIVDVDEVKKVKLGLKGRGMGKFKGGIVVDIAPTKVPRLIGKKGSMINMIKNKTGCKIVVGQNGLVWVKGSDDMEQLVREIINLIEREAHTSGLTDRVKNKLYLDIDGELPEDKEAKLAEEAKAAEQAVDEGLKAPEIQDFRDEVEEEHFNEEIAISDYVSVPSINMNGTVIRIKGNKAYIVSDEGMGFEVELSRLHKEIRRENKKSRNIAHYVEQIDTSLKLELNIIGLHRDEALEQLIKYIDKCRVRSFKTVRIIHGFGNGILRKMTHEYLDKQKDLTYRLGDINEGGGGATVVNFK